MSFRLLLLLPAASLLSACVTHDGVYTPDCIAFAGDRIELESGRFVWDKFTDQVEISEAGERVDRYPDFPARGRYLVDGERITFIPETDVSLPERYLVRRGRQHYLLTIAQFETWQDSGDFANCALILDSPP